MSGDVIKFDVYIRRDNKVTAYIMPLVTNTANVKFKHSADISIKREFKQDANINRIEYERVEL